MIGRKIFKNAYWTKKNFFNMRIYLNVLLDQNIVIGNSISAKFFRNFTKKSDKRLTLQDIP